MEEPENVEGKTENVEKKVGNVEEKAEEKVENMEEKTENIEEKTEDVEKKTDLQASGAEIEILGQIDNKVEKETKNCDQGGSINLPLNEEIGELTLDDHIKENAPVESVDISVNVTVGNELPINQNDTTESRPESKSSADLNNTEKSASKVILVTINNGEMEKGLKVEVLNTCPKKPFLGGFRHKITGVEFLNASCQTFPKQIFPSGVHKSSRDTQTVQIRNQIQQTFNSTSTQMTKPGCYVSDVTDKIIIPGVYVTADEKEHAMLEKVIVLQSYWRRWLATRYVHQLRKDRDFRIEWEQAQEEQKAAERMERLHLEYERRMKPKSKADFDLLYAALERWRREEIERINQTHSGPERKAALIGLLEQESYLIQSIERHRIISDKDNLIENISKFLNKAALPKFWRAFDGKMTEMNTQHTLRAQELRDLYNSLQMMYLTQDERLDVLLTLKHTVKEHDCKLTQELMELIDREADLLTRGIKVANLEGLRQRITTLFLQYCKTPLFNPEVARLLKVPQDSSNLRKDIYFCPSCNSYLTSSEFSLASNSRIVGRCKKCSKLDNNARLRHDFTKVRCMLQHLRRTEEAFNDGSKIAFIIQDADLQYLIENIWNSQSVLSGLEELYDLVFVRWNKHEHWSPWNCVLLTKEEASAHMKLENIVEAYGRIFIGKVHHRHVLARKYFSKLTKISDNMPKRNSIVPPQQARAVVN